MKQDISIIYEDEWMFAINKPARIASVPSEGIPIERSMLGIVQKFCHERGDVDKPYLLHRIDMQTSGVLMFGKHEKDRVDLEDILTERDTQKKYIALVKGLPKGTVITANLKARTSNVKIFAQTQYRVIRVYKVLGTVVSLVEAQIKTGRKHQIRQHFADIKCPVVDDPVYGDFAFNRRFRVAYRLGRQFLHAGSVTFIHPMTKVVTKIVAPLPMDLESILEKISEKKPAKVNPFEKKRFQKKWK